MLSPYFAWFSTPVPVQHQKELSGSLKTRIDPGRSDHQIATTPKVVGGMTPACVERASDDDDLLAPVADALHELPLTLGERAISRGHKQDKVRARHELLRQRLVLRS